MGGGASAVGEAALVTAVGSGVNEAITSRMQYFLEVGLAQGARRSRAVACVNGRLAPCPRQ